MAAPSNNATTAALEVRSELDLCQKVVFRYFGFWPVKFALLLNALVWDLLSLYKRSAKQRKLYPPENVQVSETSPRGQYFRKSRRELKHHFPANNSDHSHN